MDQASTSLKDVNLNTLPRPEDEADLDDSKYGTFVFDPNILAPWEPGFGEGDDDEQPEPVPRVARTRSTEENHPTPSINDVVAHQETKAVQEQPATQGSLDTKNSAEMGVSEVKKKKKNKKSKSKRGLNAPTGFEEFYVDAPVTPAEHEEELEMYDSRIEIAIQRFFSRRNMDPIKKDVFDKYMAFGGISSGPKQFSGGLSKADMSDMNATDIALMKAIHFVDLDRYSTEENYVVDFEACVKSFFSARVPMIYDLTGADCAKEVHAKTNIIRNFLNYLLHHDVCPEYKDQVVAARNACDLTDKELPMAMTAAAWFPGDFQTACSVIFGGSCQDVYARNPGWDDDFVSEVGMDTATAQNTFKIGLAAQSSDEMSKIYMEQNSDLGVSVVKVYDIGLEVIEVIPAPDEIRRFYEGHPSAKGLKSLGRLKARKWQPPHTLPQDFAENEKEDEAKPLHRTDPYEFLIEDDILRTCFVGMKFEATVRELSFGLKFFDAVTGV
ncbi:MAG: hypothetical protein Q9174_005661, partial [Haloplaca sp. 1 TL-2023]